MGLTYAEACRAGIGHLYPGVSEPIKRPVLDGLPVPSPTPDDGLNGLERAFFAAAERAKVDRRIDGVIPHPFRLRLAGRTTYQPDFIVSTHLELPLIVETKGGFFRDDARVKIKVAAEQYRQFFGFVLIHRPRKRDWECRWVTSRGIERATWCFDWLC
jgi:hypothetical protein